MVNLIRDLSINGDMVKPLSNKGFKIGKHTYEKIQQEGKEDIEKLKLSIMLMENEMILDYYPNKSSQKSLVAKYGMDLDQWIGQLGEFEVVSQKVMGQTKNVLYVKTE